MRKLVSLLVMFVVLAVPAIGFWLLLRPLPSNEGVCAVPNLQSSVTVQFDGRAIPYIEAHSQEDAYIAQGYLTARDRLFQMDMLRRRATGNLSEVYGPAALPTDKLMRTIGFSRLGDAEWMKLSPDAQVSLKAYAAGINAYIKDADGNLPLEFSLLAYKPKAWQPMDSLAIMKLLAYELDDSWQLDEVRQQVADRIGGKLAGELFASYDGQALNLAREATATQEQKPPVEVEKVKAMADTLNKTLCQNFASNAIAGSTAFAVSRDRSDHNGCLLAADKHTSYSVPDAWWLCTMAAPGFKVAGATIPGIPGVMYGRNENCAWSSASMKADVQDLFLEEFSPQFPNQYRTKSGWETAKELTEIIPVRFSNNLKFKVVSTEHGPVLLKNDNTGIALSWTGFKTDSPGYESMWRLNRVSSWDTFNLALSKYSGPPQVYVFCDRKGTYGYHACGEVPVRTGNQTGAALIPGWQAKGQWLGGINFPDLPYAFNTADGFVVFANQRLKNASYALYSANEYLPPYRANRITTFLNYYQKVNRKVGLPDLNQVQADADAPLAAMVRDRITEAMEETKLIDQNATRALTLLKSWDGQLQGNSAAGMIYEAFLVTMMRRMVEPKIGPKLTEQYLNRFPLWMGFAERVLKEKKTDWLPPEERTYSTFIVTTFLNTLSTMRVAQGTEDMSQWSWQKFHKVDFEHVMASSLPWTNTIMNLLSGVTNVGVGGDSNTVNAYDVQVAFGEKTLGPKYNSKVGPTMRMLIDMSDDDKFYQSISLGQSGQALSGNSHDQLNSWLKVDPLPMPFSNAQAEKQQQHKLILVNHLTHGS